MTSFPKRIPSRISIEVSNASTIASIPTVAGIPAAATLAGGTHGTIIGTAFVLNYELAN